MKSIVVLFALIFFGGSAAKASSLSSIEILEALNERNNDHISQRLAADKIFDDANTFKLKGHLTMPLANLVSIVLKKNDDLSVSEAIKIVVKTLEENDFTQHTK